MKVEEVMEQARDTLGSKRIFGEPYEKNGMTIIPAARVMGGAGGGDAAETAADGQPELAGKAVGSGGGVGYGMIGSPAGAFVIKGDKVSWLPAVDVNRLMLGFQVMFIVFFLVMRSIARSRAANA